MISPSNVDQSRRPPALKVSSCRLLSLFVLGLGASFPAHAAPLLAGEGSIVEQDFRFADGEGLPTLKLHYRTLGVARRDPAGKITNAVLMLHGTTGSAETFLAPGFADALYGPGQPLDTTKYFLVIPDGIGAGGSSKPSDGLHARFPHYGYVDQVRAQHDLTSALGIQHLKLVIGTSMGGMQTWLWGETYPDAADAYVAVASTPAAISGRNKMWREMIAQSIRLDPDWREGDYPADKPPTVWARTALPLFAIMTDNAEQLQAKAPTGPAAATFVKDVAARGRAIDANDYLYTFESSRDYDPAPRLKAIVKPLLTINFADDLLNPPGLLRVPPAQNITAVMLSGGTNSYGHQTLSHAALWAPALSAFLGTLPGF